MEPEDASWLSIETGLGTILRDHDRIAQVIDRFDSTNYHTSFLHFIGQEEKLVALKQIFVKNKFRKASKPSTVRLFVDNASISSDRPVIFSETGENQIKKNRPSEDGYCLEWAQGMDHEALFNTLHARLLCMFADVICIFADDFQDHDQVSKLILAWIKLGIANIHCDIKPTLVIVRRKLRKASVGATTKIHDPLEELQLQHKEKLGEHFTSFKILDVARIESSAASRFHTLKDCLWKELDATHENRRRLQLAISAKHLEQLFRCTLIHFCHTPHEDFDFVKASRRSDLQDPTMAVYIANFIRKTQQCHVKRVIDFIAAALLLDAYPLNGDLFLPEVVYDRFYKPLISKALMEVYGTVRLTCDEHSVKAIFPDVAEANNRHLSTNASKRDFLSCISERLSHMFRYIHQHDQQAKHMFLFTLKVPGVPHIPSIDWASISNENFCICLRYPSDNVLSCGHSLCDNCIRLIGEQWIDADSAVDDQYLVKECPLCGKGNLLVGLRPPTAGIRLLTLDGGGVRGKISIMILKMMEEKLHNLWRLQDMFDVAFGTSVGGLTVLLLFLTKTSVSEAAEIFNPLARELFPPKAPNRSATQLFWQTVKSLWRDSIYDAENLEQCLMKRLGENTRLFNYQYGKITNKVGVIASELGNAAPVVLTSYNTAPVPRQDRSFKRFEPSHGSNIKTWQAARATSAAPVLFRATEIKGIGWLQDGGMSGQNNPLHVARADCLRIAPMLNDLDIAISIGTGRISSRDSPTTGSFRNILLDGGIQRVWRAYMTNSFDGEKTFEEVVKLLPKKRKDDYIRLNVELPPAGIGLDDATQLDVLEQCIHNTTNLKSEVDSAMYALVVTSFYFKLDKYPVAPASGRGFLCSGSIRHRLPGRVLVAVLRKIHPYSIGFHEVGRYSTLGYYEGVKDLCTTCQRFCKKVRFHVADFTRPINIEVCSSNRQKRRISPLPQEVGWFIEQQRLERHPEEGASKNQASSECLDCQKLKEELAFKSLEDCKSDSQSGEPSSPLTCEPATLKRKRPLHISIPAGSKRMRLSQEQGFGHF